MTQSSQCFADTAFFARTWDEALALSKAARGYANHRVVNRISVDDSVEGLAVCCEMMRVTARLTQVMAWLLVQQAVSKGEMTSDEAAQPANRLELHPVCNEETAEQEPGMPPRLKELLQESRSLYQRVARLDEMVAAGRA